MDAMTIPQTLSRGRKANCEPWAQIGNAAEDLFFIFVSAFGAFYFRFIVPGSLPSEVLEYPVIGEYLGALFLYAVLIVAFCQNQNLYRTMPSRSGLDETVGVFRSVLAATFLLAVFIFLLKAKEVSRVVFAISAVANFVTMTAWRLWRRRILERRVAQGVGTRNVLIIGAGRMGQDLARYFETNKRLGFVVKGFLDTNHSGDSRLLGKIEELPHIARRHFIEEVFITIPSAREIVRAVALEAREHRIGVNVVPDLYDGLGWRAPIEFLGDFPVMNLHREPIPVLGVVVKRLTDIVASFAGLAALSPLLAAIAIAIKWDSPGPVFFRATRVGRKGRKFTCYKFRSMVQAAEALKEQLRRQNERQGPTFKMADDPRITRLGKFLRRYSLDELPQLINVLKGDMSLVGPRPHPLDDYDRYTLEHLRRLDVTPGITGLWQVSARRDPSFEKNLALDLEYIENWTLWMDIGILLKTVPAVLRGTGA